MEQDAEQRHSPGIFDFKPDGNQSGYHGDNGQKDGSIDERSESPAAKNLAEGVDDADAGGETGKKDIGSNEKAPGHLPGSAENVVMTDNHGVDAERKADCRNCGENEDQGQDVFAGGSPAQL